MDATLETLEHPATPTATRRRNGVGAVHAPPPSPVLMPWLQAQAINVNRHAAALRPFRRDEFGTGAAAPTEAHLQAANDLVRSLRTGLLRLTRKVTSAVDDATGDPTTPLLQQVVRHKEKAHNWVRAIERIWDFYFELFGQRQSE